jgi:hypothetical protein
VQSSRLRFGALVASCIFGVLAPLVSPVPASASGGPATVVPIDPIGGTPTDVSCPTSSFCLAVDDSGGTVAYQHGSWGPPTVVNPGAESPNNDYALSAVSCVSADFCVTIDEQGDALTWNGGSWTRTPEVTGRANIGSAVACVSTTFCVAVAGSSATTFDGSNWSTPTSAEVPNAQHLSTVSCLSPTDCVALDTQGNAAMFDGQSWTTAPGVFGTVADVAVSCGSTSCVAVAGTKAATWDGQAWSPTTTVPGASAYLTSISCPADNDCVATDNAGNAFTLANGTWTESADIDAAGGLVAISCADATFCMAVDSWGYATASDAGDWGRSTLADQDTGGLDDVSCPTGQFCAAVDESGNAVTFDGSTWTAPAIVDPHAILRLVSCASASFCVAVGSTRSDAGLLYTYDGAAWTEVTGLPLIDSISCPTTTFCTGIGANGEIIRYDGLHWTSTASGLNNFVGPLTCPTAHFCSTDNYRWDGQQWSAAPADEHPPAGHPIACSSSTFCAVPDHSYIYVYDGTQWTLTAKGFWDGTAISCPSPSFCAVSSDSSGSIWPLDDQAQGAEVAIDPAAPRGLQGLSCPTLALCVAVDYTNAVQWSTGRDHPAPQITIQPVEQTSVPSGTQVSLSAAASGVPDPTVQWESSSDGQTWADIANATSDTLTLTATASRQYRAEFTNPAGTVPSDDANVTVETSPEITHQPVGEGVLYGHQATFTAKAKGTPKPTVSWQRSVDHGAHWLTIPGATTRTYSVVAKSSARYRAVFANAIGTTKTDAARLAVLRKPAITVQPQSRTARRGSVVRFTAAASGTPGPIVFWEMSRDRGRHWTGISGAASDALHVRATKAASGRAYRARFVNDAGSATTHAATLHVS